MNQFIFKNRWFAAGFVAFILIGTYLLAGEGGLLSRAGSIGETRQPDAPPAAMAPLPTAAPPPMTSEDPAAEHEAMDDEDLIDSANGMDPTPPDELAASDSQGEDMQDAPTGDDSASDAFEYVNGIAIIKRKP
ncbi:hypothetical protein SZ64_12810 [Erythrobacter sp. SG61-1L]|uniref:hypothetical protein n=1 Tax=Erythrobacter sp. SG61-1L TaxID=1603897 RepID=UPI0006C8F95B|nr:hypothetical protein [Erythrobacter sp. SG61-1L]KPL68899.1 hypothetical protein SZ64_12810 [Erythrobacter sp. SG61-1L]